jgi:hypothetical protein
LRQCGGQRRADRKEILVNSVQRNGAQGADPANPATFIYIPYDSKDRRTFIGGSDARIIMGNDEDRLLLLGRKNAANSIRKTSRTI